MEVSKDECPQLDILVTSHIRLYMMVEQLIARRRYDKFVEQRK